MSKEPYYWREPFGQSRSPEPPPQPPPPPPTLSARVTRCTTHSHACPCREYRMAKMEAALRQVEQIAVSSQSWRDGKEELDKIKWICREALAQP